VQVSPLTFLSVMNTLVGQATYGAGPSPGIAGEIKVNASAGRVKVDFFNAPRRRQAQRTGEQGFDFNTHFLISGHQLLNRHPPRGLVDNSPASCPQAPPGSTTTLYFSSQVPHGMTKGRQPPKKSTTNFDLIKYFLKSVGMIVRHRICDLLRLESIVFHFYYCRPLLMATKEGKTIVSKNY
ncbi:MAG: hypothetical protein WA129_11855, partial [Acidovorax sp.]